MNDVVRPNGSTQWNLKGVGLVQGIEKQDTRRGKGYPKSSAQEEADDIFESEFMMLKDLWNFDSVSFPVTKQVRACTKRLQSALNDTSVS